MTFQEVLKHYGSRNKIAKALGLTRQAITRWATAGVPKLQQFYIEIDTKGKLKRSRS